MNALIVLSHGSRHPQAAAGIEAIARGAERYLSETYQRFAGVGVAAFAAHLEFDEPGLTARASELVALGYEEATVVPLLFTEGFHHKVDVPETVEGAEAASGLRMRRAASLGCGEDMARVVAGAVPAGDAHVALLAVGSAREEANAQTRALAARVAELTGRGVSVVYATRGPESALTEVARRHGDVYLQPLFITEGLLLDKVRDALPDVAAASGARLRCGAPLGESVAELVAQRYVAAASNPLRHIVTEGI